MGDALVQSGRRYEAATYCALHARVPRWGTVVVSLLSPYCAPFSRLCGVTHACAPSGHCPLCHCSFPTFALFAFGKKMGCTRECPRKKQAFSLVVPLVCTFCLRQEDGLHSGVPKKKASFFLGRSPRLHFLPLARRWAALGSAQEKSKLFPWSFPSFALFAFGKKMSCTRECPRKKQAFSLVVPLVCTFCLRQEDGLHSGVPKKKASFFLGRSPRLLYLSSIKPNRFPGRSN